MVKRFIIVIIMVVTSTFLIGCNKTDDIKESTKLNSTPSVEPCEFLNEWDSSLFEVFGFNGLEPPYRSHYPEIEKGRTYLKGQFKVDNYEAFEQFFREVYKVMWGEIVDISQVLKKEGEMYSFSDEYVVTEIYREAIGKGFGSIPRTEKYAWIEITYDESDGKCVIECKMLAELGRK